MRSWNFKWIYIDISVFFLFLCFFSFFFLFFNLIANLLNDLIINHFNFFVIVTNTDLNIFCIFYNFEQCLNAKSNGLFFSHINFPFFFQELSQIWSISPDGISFPLIICAWWLCLVKFWFSIHNTSEEAWDTEWTHSTFLSVFLFNFSDIFCNIFNCWLVFHVKSETLAFKSSFIN